LSGNGLSGTLGELLPQSALTDLEVAGNNLVGSIPLSIQSKSGWKKLDL
jgi:hypothetical protein